MYGALSMMVAVAVALPGKHKEPSVIDAHILEGQADAATLWLRDHNGRIVAFDRASGVATTKAELAFDLMRAEDGRLLAGVVAQGATKKRLELEVVDVATGQVIAPRLTLERDAPLALVQGAGMLFVVSAKTLQSFDGTAWHGVALGRALEAGIVSSSIVLGTTIIIGFNRGEFGGPPYRIDTATGKVVEVTTTKGERIMPVTGVAIDHEVPGCALIAIGLEHFASAGAVIRHCEQRTETIFMRTVDKKHGNRLERALAVESSYPIFAMLSSAKGWLAVSRGKLFRSIDTIVTEYPLPELSPWHGLVVSFDDPDAVIVQSSLNAARSVGGAAPLLVPVHH